MNEYHARAWLTLPTDLTNSEWAVIEPLPGWSARWSLRRIAEALLYLLSGGLPWRMLPPETFPPSMTVQYCFYIWRSIGHAMVMAAREQARQEASSRAGVIDAAQGRNPF